MLNNSVYKQALFLISGNVEQKTGTTDLDKLGGLSKTMPLTYIAALIASLSISGVPPFNGFVSKWMVYQGVIQNVTKSPNHQVTSIICLVAAMFGSGLTLASFMKLIHATFLGQTHDARVRSLPARGRTTHDEVQWIMWLPPIILAIVCVVFGVFANQIPIKYFILPAVTGVTFMGTWYAGLASLLIVIGLVLGIIIFKLKGLRPSLREDKAFVGAEVKDLEGASVTGTEFYNTIKELGLIRALYKKLETGFFDFYEQGKKLVFSISGLLQRLHNGILPTYLVWGLLGMLGLFFLMNR